ncbi:hypothetical protein [Burkholderia ambifaria]|uniref:hypothetical protein n=1 Tax=Burkholderia ambifaria TaxID=152480 RepID=UPI003C79D1EB
MPDLLRDRTLGHAEFVGGQPEIEVARGGLERAKRIERREPAGTQQSGHSVEILQGGWRNHRSTSRL